MSENKEELQNKASVASGEKEQKLLSELTEMFREFQVKNKVVIQWIPVPQFIEVPELEDEEDKE